MRQIVLDTETTGLEPKQGHRIIEIGCVEIVNRRETDRHFHQYLNPDREIDDGAFNIHGISKEFLADKPRFSDIAQEFIDFIRDSELIIHNAPFDVGFLDAELKKLGKKWGKIENYCAVVDTLMMAREKHPGQKNNLDALTKRYEVDNSKRDLHGALLDAQILLDVYLVMTGGQEILRFDSAQEKLAEEETKARIIDIDRKSLRVIEATAEELVEHEKFLERIKQDSGGKCVWIDCEYD